MIYIAVFLLSLSSLAFEILLARIFSISQWNHLSFMVISVALFGFAASGTFFNLFQKQHRFRGMTADRTICLKALAILYSSSAILSFLMINNIPFDYFRIPFEPVQLAYLFVIYTLLSLPFFFTGLVIMIGYARHSEKSGRIYFATMLGSSIGTVLPILLLPFLGEVKLLISVSLIPLGFVFFEHLGFGNKTSVNSHPLSDRRKSRALTAACMVMILVSAIFLWPAQKPVVRIESSPYKALSQFLKYPKTRIIKSISSIRGRIDLLTSPFIRYAPGLSLKYDKPLSAQMAAFKDGDHPFYLYPPDLNELAFSRFTLQYAGYLLAPVANRVLLIQNGGGSALPCAMTSGAEKITILEQNPHISKIIEKHYHHEVINESPRSFLLRSNESFDVVHVENWGPSLSGAAALSQEHLLTIDAFTAYLQNLTENGLLIVSRRLHLPPGEILRIFATAYESLRQLNVKHPENHIVVLRNWDTFTLLLFRTPFKSLTRLKNFVETLNFDMVFAGGRLEEFINQYNQFDQPYHASAVADLFEAYHTGTETQFFNNYLIDVRPQTDARPFPNHFFKWSTLKEVYQSTGSRFFSLFISGEIIVWTVFAEAAVISLVLTCLLLWPFLKNKKRLQGKTQIYFLGIGAGFMFTEMFFIKSYTLLFADPVISFSVVLASVLIFSSGGGIYSQKIGEKSVQKALLFLIGLLLVTFFCLSPILHEILALPSGIRTVIGILLLFPAGFLAGIPFPVGMRHLLKDQAQRGFAWTVNGCASVLAAIASAEIALSMGIYAILAAAIAFYMLALIFAPGRIGFSGPS